MSSSSEPIVQFANYPFSSDDIYQHGLASLLDAGVLNGKTGAEKAEILRRSEVFYFNRVTGNSITVEDTVRLNQLQTSPSTSEATTEDNPITDELRVLSFAELKSLIEQGKTNQIPNNKHIPDAINDATPSESTAPSRKKPWETTAAGE